MPKIKAEWIEMAKKEPKIGERVITRHQLNRIDLLKFDGQSFWFPITCPVDKEGSPLGFTSCYPKTVITHWLPLPSLPMTNDGVKKQRTNDQ
jgi:hypothetical protein